MYVPKHFAEERIDVLTDLIRARPLATLVSLGDDGLVASHVPLIWDPDPAPFGTLTGHLARANPHTKLTPSQLAAADALAIFHGPEAYVTPSWYASKRDTGKAVPTWGYAVVHASGPLRLIDDPGWLLAFVTRLTELEESAFAAPWQVGDAPEAYVEQLLKAIVGIEIPVARLEGKWKMNQNRSEADVEGTIDGLTARGDARSLAVADVMRTTHAERVKR